MSDNIIRAPSKTILANKLGISRSTLYYKSKKDIKDNKNKVKIEEVLDSSPSYGHKRVAIELDMNKKKVLRLMKKFNLKPRICRNKKFFKPGDIKLPEAIWKNELLGIEINDINIAWARDFAYIKYKG